MAGKELKMPSNDDLEKIQTLRDADDNKRIDDTGFADVEEITFDEWEPIETAEYYSAYLGMLSRIYNIEDERGSRGAELFSQCELGDLIDLWIEKEFNVSVPTLAEIHACNDYLNGEDPFGENKGD